MANGNNPTPQPQPAPSGGLPTFTYQAGGGASTTDVAGIPGAGYGYGGGGSVYIPREFTRNAGVNVPGFGPYQWTGVGSVRAAEIHMGNKDEQYGDTPLTLQQALIQQLSQAQNDPQGTQALQEQLIRAGYLNPSDRSFQLGVMHQTDATYHALSVLFNDAIVSKTPFQDLLDEKANDKGNKVGMSYWQRYLQKTGQAPTEQSYTSTVTDYSTMGDAYSAAKDEYQRLLGRNANSKEVAALHAALNAYEGANPQKVTKDVTITPSLGAAGYQERNVTQSGGTSAGDRQMVTDAQINKNDGAELATTQINRLVQKFEAMLGSAR